MQILNNTRGFTLMELLISVTLVGILTAVAVPQYYKVIEHSRAAEGFSCVDVIKGTYNRFTLDNDSIYPNMPDVTAAPPAGLDNSCRALRYFSGSVAGGNGTYTVTLTRNNYKFPSVAWASMAGYKLIYIYSDSVAPIWTTSTCPAAWLPE